ncbi:copper resistance protein NlpE [Faecalibacter sp. LW9]|uniref:copper resistance protein NlpE n=1 Tax=Faecalibacter sp. LW9 TaxID=3103144 RepID=UPI002AFF0BDB|nr:copper resistance protein NlpE N-terminal domain-containing protein [Faecalibacter sp. LW9]
MKKIFVALTLGVTFAMLSCKNDAESVKSTNTTDTIKIDSTTVDTHTAQTSIDYEGTYEGVLPCIKSDCKEIELKLQLMPDGVFVYSTKRLGIDQEELMTTGTFHFENDGNTIVLDQIANVPNAFFISEGKIYQLDKDQKKIEGPDAEKYILLKK